MRLRWTFDFVEAIALQSRSATEIPTASMSRRSVTLIVSLWACSLAVPNLDEQAHAADNPAFSTQSQGPTRPRRRRFASGLPSARTNAGRSSRGASRRGPAAYGERRVRDRAPIASAHRRESRRLGGPTLHRAGIEAEAFYTFGHPLSLFAQLRAMEEDLISHDGEEISDVFVERGEMWLSSENIGGTGLSFDFGHLDFEDDRRWWWDGELDATRVTVEVGTSRSRSRWVASSSRSAPTEHDRSRAGGVSA